VCDFCGRFDKKFENEDYRDLHLYNVCPMIMICEGCAQAVEINTFTAHQVGECKNSKYFKKCPRCKEAVHQSNYKVHVEKKECIPFKPPAGANRCPLCHLDIDPGKEGWKSHLVTTGCENNPRK
jgi:centrosomal protein CEP104